MRECYELIIKGNPEDVVVREIYGRELREIGLYEKAKEQYMEAISIYNLRLE